MALLAANVSHAAMPRPDPAMPVIERNYTPEGADEFYRGAVVCKKNGANYGLVCTNANADWGLGICVERKTVTASLEPVKVAISGVWWFAAVACADASLFLTIHPLAGSDNPADVTATAAGAPSTLGILVHVDVTGTSGWIHLGWKVLSTLVA